MNTVYLGLGSNQGDRAANLRAAVLCLEQRGFRIVRKSSLYETEPQIVREQPWFLNAVVESQTTLLPRLALTRIREAEKELGRKRTIPKGPRVIDIDILAWGKSIVDTEELSIPHPGLRDRRFVLEPLAEIAPDWRHPLTHESVKILLASVLTQTVRLAGTW